MRSTSYVDGLRAVKRVVKNIYEEVDTYRRVIVAEKKMAITHKGNLALKSPQAQQR